MKMYKKIISLILVMTICIASSATVFATERRNPDSVEGQYVEELVQINQDELSNLTTEEAKLMFEKAFLVPANDYTEDEIRQGLDGLAFGLKFQVAMEEIKETVETEPSLPYEMRSTTGGKKYSGDVGVAWVRDTTKGHSPLTLGEILSGTYTLEVDYITWDTAASILASSANYDAFKDLVELVGVGAAGTALSSYICSILGITGGPATVASVAVGAVVGLGWNWLNKIDRSNMLSCFNDLSKNQYMKVQFMWSSNMVNKFYTRVSKGSSISNPFPGTYGDWYSDKFGYLYNY